jgi:GNAT superfamily N-acetyltransferase
MVREFKAIDMESIIELFDLHCELSNQEKVDKRKELETKKDLYVYDSSDTVLGMCSLHFWKNDEIGHCAEVILSIKHDTVIAFNRIAEALWKKIMELVHEQEVVMLMTHHNVEDTRWNAFFDTKGFETWFSIYGMIYHGKRFPSNHLTYRHYEDSDFECYYKNLGASFYEMRKALDIKPYDLYRSASNEKIEKYRESTLKQRDRIYIFSNQNQIVGSSILLDEDIDDVFVLPELQGNGYGKMIMEASVNLKLDLGHQKITLGVVDWNKRAINLYHSLGFETYRSFVHKRMFIK